MDEWALRTCIRTRLQEGKIPRNTPRVQWAGYGAGQHCDACGEIIGAKDVEYELVFSPEDGSVTARLHLYCCELWQQERARVQVWRSEE